MLLSSSCPLLPPGNESFPSSCPQVPILLPGPRPGSPPLLGEGHGSALAVWPPYSPHPLATQEDLVLVEWKPPSPRGTRTQSLLCIGATGLGHPGPMTALPGPPLPHLQTGKLAPSSTWSVDRVPVSIPPQHAGCAGGWPCPPQGAPGRLETEVAP